MSQKRRFTAQPKTIQHDLRRVMQAMDATSLKISQDMFEGTAEIVFDRAGQRYVFRCSKYEEAMDNLRAAQLTITSLWRALEEYGVTSEAHTLDQAFARFFLGFAATPDDMVLLLGSGQEAWWKILGVEPEADMAAVRNPYRALARLHHPDAGGCPEEFKRLRQAYEAAVTAIAAGSA